MINWRQLYNESQTIQPTDSNISTERINRLVNIYKNDMVEQDLHQYAQRLSRFVHCCQTCTPKSYTIYKWLDTYISGNKSLFDFRLSGRSVSALVYYWNKTLLKQCNERGQLSDFEQNKDVLFSPFEKNISPIFICFIHEDNNLRQLFWTFRHLITIFNWPLTTKIFSNCSFETCSIFERVMANYLGFIDLSTLNLNQNNLFCYLYRCLKTCHQNGPIIFIFDYSTIFKPKFCDYYLMSFLCDLIRFDLSIPDVILIPIRLHKSYLSFNQPFLFKELVEFFIKKMNIQTRFCEVIKSEQQKLIYKFIDCIFLHLAYDTNQLVSTTIEFQHIIASIELCQIPSNLSTTVETIYNTLQTILKTCPFIIMDDHKWNEITRQHIEQYYLKLDTYDSKSKLISIIRKEYFLDILAALSILSKVQHNENFPRIFEFEIFNQIAFLLFTFGNKQYLNIRSCQNIHQNIQQIIQHCQSRNYISITYIPQKSMRFRDTILSDHEWSDDDDDDVMDDEFVDHDNDSDDGGDDEIIVNDLSNKISETIKLSYRINYHEYHFQLKFFAKLFGSYIEAIVYILKYHIDKQMKSFTLEQFNFNQSFYFRETSYLISNDVLSFVRRAYTYRSIEHFNTSDDILTFFEPIDDPINPLLIDNLVALHNEFVKLLNCCCSEL
ncbi:unnamed protein product [Rotaria sp. Silwood1]|nr:unnamed protein product [Rotaria sp. Silwood1]